MKSLRRGAAAVRIHNQISIQSLRQSYVTLLIEAGLNLRKVQAQLGHADADTTAHYIRMTEVVKHECRKGCGQ